MIEHQRAVAVGEAEVVHAERHGSHCFEGIQIVWIVRLRVQHPEAIHAGERGFRTVPRKLDVQNFLNRRHHEPQITEHRHHLPYREIRKHHQQHADCPKCVESDEKNHE